MVWSWLKAAEALYSESGSMASWRVVVLWSSYMLAAHNSAAAGRLGRREEERRRERVDT